MKRHAICWCWLALAMFFVPVTTHAKSAEEALHLLQLGNERFVENSSAQPRTDTEQNNMKELASQNGYAYATVLACSDSRVPVERIFDARVMDIFTVKVAGNVISNDVTASIEYGVGVVETPVLVILGHTHCGAVGAAVHAHEHDEHPANEKGDEVTPAIKALLDRILPAVEEVDDRDPDLSKMGLWEASVKQNVWLALEDLFEQSELIRTQYAEGGVRIVCAVYDIQTGMVHWYDEGRVKEVYDAVVLEK